MTDARVPSPHPDSAVPAAAAATSALVGTSPVAALGAPAPVSGPRFELRSGDARAVIGSVAAVLCELEVDGHALTETVPVDSLPPQGCGIVLAPWPNRVRGARWTLRAADSGAAADAELELDLTDPKWNAASHGLLRNTAYRLVDHTPSTVELAALIPPQHGWPFELETRVRYALEPDGLVVTHHVSNVGATRAPWAVGAHPYLRVGDTPAADLELRVPAGVALEVDATLIPVGAHPVGDDEDLRAGSRVGDLELNTAFVVNAAPHSSADDAVDAVDADGAREIARLTAPGGAATQLWGDPAFLWVQVFTPSDFPRPLGGHEPTGKAVALEPMTAPADALNSGEGLLWLEPGASWSASWGIRRIAGAEKRHP
ncbi:aldose 1-epimerase family protein [Schumannella luteola]|uniref:Aldose 1-epimerase n=1 Tax=Schumannella luteola TaxID=472059 RepID=A0A852YIW2_9MICO|nr:aldose 1-epimerase family protein [Schumannella luteola]NYG99068.1 aldose 1-epimerase [Schumannella luteola]TPX06420.1 aldose 1-epimerase family protein [Schumannella luteola]